MNDKFLYLCYIILNTDSIIPSIIMADVNSLEEQKRLAALRSYHILDTAEEKDYDDLTELASAICDTPIALISFVDKDRQWFKSHYGLEANQTERCHSFCSYAIQNPENLMQVEDARHDRRFQDNPLVTGSPDIRFYAGMPLLDEEGHALGSICVIDHRPRLLNAVQQKALRTLAQQVIDKLSLRKNNVDLLKANQQLVQAKFNLQIAISAAKLGIWHINARTREFLPSERLKELYGFYPDEEMTYDAAVSQIADSHRQEVIDAVEASITKGESYEVEYPIVGYHDKILRWVNSTGHVYTNPENPDLSHFSGTTTDITERKLDEQRRSDFIGMVSHELRNPLTAIKAYAYILKRAAHKNNDEMLASNVVKIDNQINRMEALINGFLDVARLGEGKIRLNRTRFDMAYLVRISEEESLATINSHQVVFAPVEFTPVEADQDKIEQVLLNFINNAVKYSPNGSIINVACVTNGGFAYVYVKDQGMGIPLKDQPFIFDRFYRVESEAMKDKKGFGIGLYICKEIIERHNGQIGVESIENQGSIFWFTLPIFTD